MALPLLTKLQDSKTDCTVLTEVAWALGKIPDKRSIQPLYDLDKKLRAIRDPDNVTSRSLRKPCSGRSNNVMGGISIAAPSCYNFASNGIQTLSIAHIRVLRQLLV